MQTLQPQKNQYQTFVAQPILETPRPGLLTSLRAIYDRVVSAFTADPEVKVWKTEDGENTTLWHVYDPCTKSVKTCTSEYEAKAWIEEFYGVE